MNILEKMKDKKITAKMTDLMNALNEGGKKHQLDVWTLEKDENNRPVITMKGALPLGAVFALGNCGIGLAGEADKVEAFVKMGVSENHYKRDTGLRYKKEIVDGEAKHTIFVPADVEVKSSGSFLERTDIEKAVFNVNAMYDFTLSRLNKGIGEEFFMMDSLAKENNK